MFQSDSIKEISKALAKAQSEFKPIPFDKVNPHFKSKYASLSATFEMIRPILGSNGLGIIQSVESTEYENVHAFVVSSRIFHTSGEFFGSHLRLILQKNDMQGLGSAVTYAKRYAAQSLLGICGDEDDDGNAASPKSSEKTRDKIETKKEYPKVEPKDFILNLGSIKDKKLSEIPKDKLSEMGSWLSETIKKDSKKENPKTKFYQYAYSQIKKYLEQNQNEPPKFEEPPLENYADFEQEYPQEISSNPFDEFYSEKKN